MPAANDGTPYTGDELERIKHLFLCGWTDRQIGLQLERGPESVAKQRRRNRWVHRVSGVPFSTEEIAELVRLHEAGESLTQIAAALNRPYGSVSSRLSEMGLTACKRAEAGEIAAAEAADAQPPISEPIKRAARYLIADGRVLGTGGPTGQLLDGRPTDPGRLVAAANALGAGIDYPGGG